MSIKEEIDLGFLIVWAVFVVAMTIGGHLHFKNKKADNIRKTIVEQMRQYVYYYDKQPMADDEKANAVIDDVAKALAARGYKINDDTIKDLKTLRELILTDLRIKQAESGAKTTVKPDPEVSNKVAPKNVVQPTEAKAVNNG